jgi:hypothetical protein
MTPKTNSHIPVDLVDGLDAELPAATPAELNRIKRRVTAGSQSRGSLIRSRFAIALILALGAAISTSGAALGVSALSSSGSASTAQYGGNSGGAVGGNANANDNNPSDVRQIAASGNGGGLPFTGYAAIPALLGGIGLLVGGFVLRRRTS